MSKQTVNKCSKLKICVVGYGVLDVPRYGIY